MEVNWILWFCMQPFIERRFSRGPQSTYLIVQRIEEMSQILPLNDNLILSLIFMVIWRKE